MYKKVKKLNQTEAAYIAALIDGEGAITLSRNNRNKHRALVVDISNTDFKLLNWVKSLVGAGQIKLKQPEDKKYAIGYAYRIRNRQALNLLTQILPYLRTYKRKRAEIVLKNYIKLTPRNGKYSLELLVRREKFIKDFFAVPGSRKGIVKLEEVNILTPV